MLHGYKPTEMREGALLSPMAVQQYSILSFIRSAMVVELQKTRAVTLLLLAMLTAQNM